MAALSRTGKLLQYVNYRECLLRVLWLPRGGREQANAVRQSARRGRRRSTHAHVVVPSCTDLLRADVLLQACVSPSLMAGRYAAGEQSGTRLTLYTTGVARNPASTATRCALCCLHLQALANTVLSLSLSSCTGRFMAYDRHMNLVLGDAEEFRKLPPKKGSKEEVSRGRGAVCGGLG